MAVRAVRGATQLEADDRDHMLERVAEMVLDATDAHMAVPQAAHTA